MKLSRRLVPIALAVAGVWLLAMTPACTKEAAPPARTEPQTPAAAPEPPVPATAPHDAQSATTEGTAPAATPVPGKLASPNKTQQGTPAQPSPEPAAGAPAPEPAAAQQPAAAQEPSAVKEPAPPESAPAVSVRPTHAAVGSEKCKTCHRIQYESWSASKHAKAALPVGCETCHGNGADYGKLGVMKDPAQAKAAGLVLPDKDFCTSKCHKPASFTGDMLQKAHAHKVK